MKAISSLILDINGFSLTNEDKSILVNPYVGGLIFFSRNIESKGQFLKLVEEVRAIRPELLLAIDQEGGRVQRLREGYTRIPPMQLLGNLVANEPGFGEKLCRDCGWLLAVELIASGLDFSFAPVLDLDSKHCEVIADRSFHVNPQPAVRAARSFIEGMNEAGMAATGKHYPGHGGVREDSHLETPRDERTLAELLAHDLIPFVELSEKLAGVMPAHIVYPAVDKDPAGFSKIWLQDILRSRLGFDGLIFSDDLSMKGADVKHSYAEKAHAALSAGCDIILVCNNRAGALETLQALGSEACRVNESGNRALQNKLSRMRAAKTWSWPELENNKRRQQTIDNLLKLEQQDYPTG